MGNNKYHKYFILYLLIVLFAGLAEAQQYRIIHFAGKDGLPSNMAKEIASDSLGFIWIGTDDGLIRYDGLNFHSYTDGLPAPNIKSFYYTKNKRLLTVTDMGVIEICCLVDTAYIKTLIPGEKTINDSALYYPKYLLEDRNDNLWISDDISVSRYSNNKLKKYKFDRKNESQDFNRSFSIVEDNYGNIYAFSEPGYSYYYDKKSDEFIELEGVSKLANISHSVWIGQGLILLGSQEGIWELKVDHNAKVESFKNVAACDGISYMLKSDGKNMFVSTWSNGLFELKISDGIYKLFPVREFKNKNVNQIFAKNSDDLWLSTDNGIFLMKSALINSELIKNHSFNINNYILDISEAKYNKKYFSAGNKVYEILKKGNSYYCNIVYKEKEGYILQVAPTEKGFWVFTSLRKVRAIEDGRVIKNLELKLNIDDHAFFVHKDLNGHLWLCLKRTSGLMKIDPEYNMNIYDKTSGLYSLVNIVRSDENGVLYCGGVSDSTYLFKYDIESDSFRNISLPLPFDASGLIINDMVIDDNKNIWLASNKGLLKYNSDKVERINLGKNTSWEVKALAIDKNKSIWFANIRGLLKYENGEIISFDEKHGLSSSVINYRSMIVDSLNQLWIGTSLGINYTLENNPGRKTPSPFFLPLIVNGQKLNHKKQTATITENSYLNFIHVCPAYPGNELLFQSRILGVNEKWSEESPKNELFIPSLPAGEYTVEVRAKQSGNYYWSNPIAYKLKVVPEWYNTKWAYVLYFISFVSFVYISVKIRSKQLERKNLKLEELISERTEQLQKSNRDKDRILGIVAHDLNNKLGSTMGFLELLKEENDINDYDRIEYSNLALESCYHSQDIIEELLEISEVKNTGGELFVESVDLYNFVMSNVKCHFPKALEKNITIQVEKTQESICCQINKSKFSRVIDNLITNAIKFTYKNGNIYVKICKDRNRAVVEVKDNGIGIPDSIKENVFNPFTTSGRMGTFKEKSTGLGLSIAKAIVKMHQGEIWFNSEEGRGSTFYISLPFSNNEVN